MTIERNATAFHRRLALFAERETLVLKASADEHPKGPGRVLKPLVDQALGGPVGYLREIPLAEYLQANVSLIEDVDLQQLEKMQALCQRLLSNPEAEKCQAVIAPLIEKLQVEEAEQGLFPSEAVDSDESWRPLAEALGFDQTDDSPKEYVLRLIEKYQAIMAEDWMVRDAWDAICMDTADYSQCLIKFHRLAQENK